MIPRRFPEANRVFALLDGPADNDLYVWQTTDEAGGDMLISEWQPSGDEIDRLQDGGRIRLAISGTGQPPVALWVEEPR